MQHTIKFSKTSKQGVIRITVENAPYLNDVGSIFKNDEGQWKFLPTSYSPMFKACEEANISLPMYVAEEGHPRRVQAKAVAKDFLARVLPYMIDSYNPPKPKRPPKGRTYGMFEADDDTYRALRKRARRNRSKSA